MSKKILIAAAAGSAFVAGLAAAPIASAAENPFILSGLSSGYQVADKQDAKPMESSNGTKDAKAMESSSGAKAKDGKCGEGKCGAKKPVDASGTKQ